MNQVLAVLVLVVLAMAFLSTGGALTGLPDPLARHPGDACSQPFHVQGAGWDVCWQQDEARGQGVELNQVYFQGESVIWRIGVPFTLTQYEDNAFGPFKDTLGSFLGNNPGFGVGSMQIHPEDCPRFLSQGTLLNDRRICVEHREGPEPALAIWARYNVENYRFLQGYVMDARGVMEPFLRLGGLLLDGETGAHGVNHFHHTYWRVDFDVMGSTTPDAFQIHLRPDEGQEPYGPLNDLPHPCRQQVREGVTGWCTVETETPLVHQPALHTKWRVFDTQRTNLHGNAKSFEFLTGSDGSPDGAFTNFDVLVLHGHGDSQEIGFEVPPIPFQGDAHLESYYDPPETVTDPVAWVALRAYHDTRDEDRSSVSYHHVSFLIHPRDFMDENPGEDTFHPRHWPPPVDPPIQTP